MLRRDVVKLNSDDEATRDAAFRELVDFNRFSVPILLEEMERGDDEKRRACVKCLKAIAQRYFGEMPEFGGDVRQWRQWWERKDSRVPLK